LPVIAYKTKGPKDIILDGNTGFLVSSKQEFITKLNEYFNDTTLQKTFRISALARAKEYEKQNIMDRFLHHVGLQDVLSTAG
jgi:glycosyltransferase involved in cell wall biosynthesis